MAVICALIIVFAGFKMMMSAGNSGAVSAAKEMMVNTLVGFVILLSAWLIVDTVMKTFLRNGVLLGPWNEIQCVVQPTTTPPPPGGTIVVVPPTPTPTTTPNACTIPALTPITDALALQMEGGQTVIFNNVTLQACVTKFIGMVGGTVTSAYRPPAYQTHLWEIRDRWCTRGLLSNTDSLCSTLKTSVSGEVQKHFGGSWSCGAVGQVSTHSSGVGVDISGPAHGTAPVQQAASESCLIWKNYPNDAVHYDLKSGCTCN